MQKHISKSHVRQNKMTNTMYFQKHNMKQHQKASTQNPQLQAHDPETNTHSNQQKKASTNQNIYMTKTLQQTHSVCIITNDREQKTF